jgi:hypothetical protein
MSSVFVSYASDDREVVRALVAALRAENIDVWWDGDMIAGAPLFENINQQLAAAHCAIICWSRAALRNERDWVRGEGEKLRTRAISVLLDDIELPVPFNARLAIPFIDWDRRPQHQAFQALIAGVREKQHHAGAGPSSFRQRRPRRRALLIDASAQHVEPSFKPLHAGRTNVSELSRVLRQGSCGFDVTTSTNPSKQDLETQLEGFFSDVQKEELLFFYFTGYAFSDGRNMYLAARDTLLQIPKSSAVALSRLQKDFLSSSDAGSVVVVFDNCYGSMDPSDVASGLQSALGAGRSLVLLSSNVPPLRGIKPWAESNSLFTRSLIRAIETDAADANGDGVVTAEEIAVHLKDIGKDGTDGAVHYWSFTASPSAIEIRQRPDRLSEDLTTTSEQKNFVEQLGSELERGKIIPFLGDGIHGSGPLSFFRIARALASRALTIDERQDMIATAAESLELRRDNRAEFLQELTDIFKENVGRSSAPIAHEMILEMNPPWVAISINYDDLLERRLDQEERSYVTVSHVIRSGDASTRDQHAGKILVTRSKCHPLVLADPSRAVELCSSQDNFISDDDCVIYKLLGSPFLHQLPAVENLQLDTVVITESDHVDLLVHLRETATGVPASISNKFRMKRLLFLEYNLDVWHYRLIGHLFRSGNANWERLPAGAVCLRRTPYVVRTATSPTEELFWKRRFNPDQVPMDLPTLVRALRAQRGVEG